MVEGLAVLGELLRGQVVPAVSNQLDGLAAQITWSRDMASTGLPSTPEHTEAFRARAASFLRARTQYVPLVQQDPLNVTWHTQAIEASTLRSSGKRECLPPSPEGAVAATLIPDQVVWRWQRVQ